jgi:hypothetical protein
MMLERRDRCTYRRFALQRRQESLEPCSAHDKPPRHTDAGPCQLAEACALAADLSAIGKPDLPEPGDVRERTHESC